MKSEHFPATRQRVRLNTTVSFAPEEMAVIDRRTAQLGVTRHRFMKELVLDAVFAAERKPPAK